MSLQPNLAWDPRMEKEIRQVLAELRALEESGRFDGLDPAAEPPVRLETAREEARGRMVAKRLVDLAFRDAPSAPALSQFMSQLAVGERTLPYKRESQRRFEDAVSQVKILFGRIARGYGLTAYVTTSCICGNAGDPYLSSAHHTSDRSPSARQVAP